MELPEKLRHACARHSSKREYDDVLNTKKKLDEAFVAFNEKSEKEGKKDYQKRNSTIQKIFASANDGTYTGKLSFSEHHAFINIESKIYGDKAMFVLYSPPKKTTSDYIGGIGSVASIAHGRKHMPTAQKIIMSKFELGCSSEVIAEHLSMSNAPVTQTNEAAALCDFCRKLYDGQNNGADFFDENDKEAMIERRLNQLVKNYIEKNICYVGSVSEDEDKKYLRLSKNTQIDSDGRYCDGTSY